MYVEVSRPAGRLPSEATGRDVLAQVADRAALLAVVADPNRLAVLTVLAEGTTCVCRLQEQVPVAANLLSYHLKVLREAGLIYGSRRGKWIDYCLTEGALDRLHEALPGRACAEPSGGGDVPGCGS
jgi:ArsR family transcriptional regulator